MGEQDRAVHEISDSRARLSELATELSRRVDKEHVKEFATEKATELKERARDFATEKATELKQQAKEVATEKAHDLKDQAKDKAIEMKDHAREAVMTKTTQLKERADSPKGWSVLGALIGAGVGSALMRKAFTVREERYEGDSQLYGREEYDQNWRYGAYDRPYDVRTATGADTIDRSDLASPARVSDTHQGLSMSGDVGFEGRVDVQGDANLGSTMKDKVSDVKERAVGMKDHLKDRAHDLKDRVRDRVPDRGELKGRAYEMRGKATHWFDRTLEEQPLLLALGGIAIGMVASSLLPVSRRERSLMEPAKHRVEERISELGDRLTDKIRGESDTGSQGLSATPPSVGMTSSPGLGLSTDLNASDTNIGPGNTGISEAHTSAEADLSSPAGSRIPPLPPLDDMTKIH
jgi:hypothetical protein